MTRLIVLKEDQRFNITFELLRFGIDIAALSETRLADSGSFDEMFGGDGYRFQSSP